MGAALVVVGPTPTMAPDATPDAGTSAGCPTTTPEENEDLVRRWYEDVWNGRDMDAIDDILADDYLHYRAGTPFANAAGSADDVHWVVQDNLGMLRQLGVITDDEMGDVGTPAVATPAP